MSFRAEGSLCRSTDFESILFFKAVLGVVMTKSKSRLYLLWLDSFVGVTDEVNYLLFFSLLLRTDPELSLLAEPLIDSFKIL